jgi:hypothetical protein
MNLRIAKFLLLLTVMGNLAPVVLAITAPNPHACCVRKSIHPCHESAASVADHAVLRSGDCCNHGCCRAVTTAQWAYPEPRSARIVLRAVNAQMSASEPNSPDAGSAHLQSARAPPAC